MRCTVHLNRPAVGYCAACGNFYCEACLTACQDGRQYCTSCVKKLNKQPVAVETPARDGRLAVKLMVHFSKGGIMKGTTYNLDPTHEGFHFVRHGDRSNAEEIYIKYADVKYVAIVASFTGAKRSSPGEYQPKGSEVMVAFKDGETLDGYTLKHYNEKEPRFSVIPINPNDNRISVLVERSAIDKMTLGRIPKAQELRKLVSNPIRRLLLHFYWKHPNIVITLDELASRLGRTPHAVERDLGEFEAEGLISRIGAPGRQQLRFTPATDRVVRDTINSMGREIDMLYFRKRQPPPTRSRTPGYIGPPK